MIGSIFDIINNISFVGWGVVISSFLSAMLCGVIFWQDLTKSSSKFLFLFGIVNASVAVVYTFFGDSFGASVGYAGMMILYITSAIVPVFLLVKYNFVDIKIIVIELFISVTVLVLTMGLFFVSSFLDLFIKTMTITVVVFAGAFLVGSIKRGIQAKDKVLHLSRELEMASGRLKVLDNKKSEFLSVAALNLLDPLTSIKGYSSMLASGSFGELSVPISDAVEKIFVSSRHLVTTISNFVDISRIDSGDMEYNFTDVDIKKLTLDVANEMKRSANHAGLTFNLTIDDSLTIGQFITIGDESKLRQVLSNLIDNSVRYTPRGEISLLLHKSPDDKKILFSLSDTGIGMSPRTLEEIFRKLARVDNGGMEYALGTGLGIYVANEIIKKHVGRIWAESKGEGTGSSFYVELPAKP